MTLPERDARGQVTAPAIGLLVSGVLNALLSLLVAVLGLFGERFKENPADPTPFDLGTAEGIVGLVDVAVALVILLGAMRMMKCRSYGLAMTASILSLVPCLAPCWLAGFPLGLWALIVLARSDVKAGFR
jgi:hypothetical protein